MNSLNLLSCICLEIKMIHVMPLCLINLKLKINLVEKSRELDQIEVENMYR